MTDSADGLIILAKQQGFVLTEAELSLLSAVAADTYVSLIPSVAADRTGQDYWDGAENWGEDRTIHAELIRWFYINEQAARFVGTTYGVNVVGAKIAGFLNLSSTDVSFRFSLAYCYLPDALTLIGATTGSLELTGCRIQGLQVYDSVVQGDVDLDRRFQSRSHVVFDHSTIIGNLNCYDSSLKGLQVRETNVRDVNLDKAKIDSVVQCHKTTIDGDFYCNGGEFGYFDVEKSTVSGDVQLANSTVAGNLILRNTTVAGDVDLSRSRVAVVARLSGSDIGGSVNADKAHGPQGFTLIADGAVIKGVLQWTNISPHSPLLSLVNTKIGSLRDDPESWPRPGSLQVAGLVYEDIEDVGVDRRLEWLMRQPPYRFNRQPYEQFAFWLQRRGQNDDGLKVLMTAEDRRREYLYPGRLSRLWSLILRATIGHGYKPLRIWIWGLVFTAIGAIVFQMGYNANLLAFGGSGKTPPTTFNPLVYSLDAFIPIIDFHQEKFWVPNGNGPFGKLLQLYMWVHIAMGWVVTTLAVAAFTGIIRKERTFGT